MNQTIFWNYFDKYLHMAKSQSRNIDTSQYATDWTRFVPKRKYQF